MIFPYGVRGNPGYPLGIPSTALLLRLLLFPELLIAYVVPEAMLEGFSAELALGCSTPQSELLLSGRQQAIAGSTPEAAL